MAILPNGKQNGGRRPGAGRPKGRVNDMTLWKAERRERFAHHVEGKILEMIDAQIEHAKGVSYMRLRNADGTFARATDEKQIDAAIAAGASWFRIFTESPSTAAFVALMDRTIDKPGEPKQEIEITGTLEVVATRLIESRRRRLRSPEPEVIDAEPAEASE